MKIEISHSPEDAHRLLGNAKRIEGYTSGRIARKERKKPIYKDVTITRGDEHKIVKANQVPQYQKFGWLRA